MLVECLEKLLADSYALFLKTQNFHWNVECPQFRELHLLFEDQYNDLFKAIDELAELIRGLGAKTIGSFAHFSALTSIESGNENLSAEEMLNELAKDQTIIEKSILRALEQAKKEEDEVVCAFLTDRLTAHRKNKWMLTSSK